MLKTQSEPAKSLPSNAEWKAWGEFDPLYGVASREERGKDGEKPWTDESFFQLGVVDWGLFRPVWQQYGLTPGTCLEIGCGAGRLTVQLATFFNAVEGIDVSAGMVAYARDRVPSNVHLQVTDGCRIPLEGESADAVFSTHVMQHLSEVAAAADYFREMYRVLRPGGSIMVHLPIIAWPWGSLLAIHKLAHRAKTFLDARRVQLGRYAWKLGLTRIPPMQVIWYEVGWLYRTLERAGFRDVEIRLLFGGSEMAVQHPFVFARKRADRG